LGDGDVEGDGASDGGGCGVENSFDDDCDVFRVCECGEDWGYGFFSVVYGGDSKALPEVFEGIAVCTVEARRYVADGSCVCLL
jgi:hypothetical protein